MPLQRHEGMTPYVDPEMDMIDASGCGIDLSIGIRAALEEAGL